MTQYNVNSENELERQKLRKMCENLFEQDISKFFKKKIINHMIYVISWYLIEYKDIRAFEILQNLVANEQVPIKTRIYLYMQLNTLKFNGTINFEVDKVIYKTIIDYIATYIPMEKLKFIRTEEKVKDRVVFITYQFLSYKHSPTKILLNMAKTLNDSFDEVNEIYIFNSTTFFDENPCDFYNGIIANYYKYDAMSFQDLLDEVGINRCGVGYDEQNDKEVVERLIDMTLSIYELKPNKVIGIGGNNILADLVSRFTEVYTYGLTREKPTSYAQYIVNNSNIMDLNTYQLGASQIMIELPFGVRGLVDKSKDEVNTREELGLPEEHFLISVVGNRLLIEVSSEFLKVCENILSYNAQVSIVFIGKYDKNLLTGVVDQEYHERFYTIGPRQNIVKAIGMTNLFLNPIRQGGGYGGLAAMKNQIPILTTYIGDIAAYLTDEFKVNDYDEMVEVANKLIQDEGYYKELQEKMEKLSRLYDKNIWDIFFEYILRG